MEREHQHRELGQIVQAYKDAIRAILQVYPEYSYPYATFQLERAYRNTDAKLSAEVIRDLLWNEFGIC